jgi:hypothetical protein
MSKLLSIAALVLGIWLIYLGYERQQSLAGKTEDSLSKISQKVDGGDHMSTHVKYYVFGTVLVVGGVFGLRLVKK